MAAVRAMNICKFCHYEMPCILQSKWNINVRRPSVHEYRVKHTRLARDTRARQNVDFPSIFLISHITKPICRMDLSTIEDDWTNNLNMSNMLDYYRKELSGLLEGKKIVDSVSLGTRKRLIEYGVLRKFGSKFELTDQGMDLLLSQAVLLKLARELT